MKKRHKSLSIIRSKERRRRIPLSDMTVWRMEQNGDFPRRIKLGVHSVGWIEDEVEEWIRKKMTTRS